MPSRNNKWNHLHKVGNQPGRTPLRSIKTLNPPSVFPHEILDQILSFAETGWLVPCSQVNLVWFELSSKHLYRDVEIKDLESLRLLFRERESVLLFTKKKGDKSVEFVPLCSLYQIRTLTVKLSQLMCDSDLFDPYLHLPFNLNPLPIDLLHITFTDTLEEGSPEGINESFLLSHLFNVVNPSAVNFRTLPHFLITAAQVLASYTKLWTRIHHVEIINSVDSVDPFGSTRTSSGAPLTVKWQPIHYDAEGPIFYLARIVRDKLGLAGGTDLLVRSKEEKIRLEEEVERAAKKMGAEGIRRDYQDYQGHGSEGRWFDCCLR